MIVIRSPRGPQSDALAETLDRRSIAVRRVPCSDDHDLWAIDDPGVDVAEIRRLPETISVHEFSTPWGLVSRDVFERKSRVRFGPTTIGGADLAVIAGPCSVESHDQLMTTAKSVAASGAHGLRGGAFKPRTSTYSFQGLGRAGLEFLAEGREATGLPVVTEVMAPDEVPLVAEFADMLQVGSRNMQNFRLLEAVGECDLPVLLKRGMMATVDEFLAAAEYVYARGNTNIALCERGIRTFEPRMRNTIDLAVVPLLATLTHLPVIVDPSHGTGRRDLVPAVARAAIAIGADGLIVEVHPSPDHARSDGAQSLDLDGFAALVPEIDAVARAIGRRSPAPAASVPTV